jgi:hypothetical protein
MRKLCLLLCLLFCLSGCGAVSDVPQPVQPLPPVEQPTVEPEPPATTQPETKPLDNPQPVPPEEVTIGETTYTCTISISCGEVLSNLDKLDSDKHELIPADDWILPQTTATFYEGESVFDVLIRTCKEHKIHMEYMDTPLYNSAYIEGIGNLYEFDCGNESGWMYCVNDWFPNYGCSQYQLGDGDVIQWIYTCDLGRDVGDNSQN